MNNRLSTVKDFLKLPEGKQFLAAALISVLTLCAVITVLWYKNNDLMSKQIRQAETIGDIRRECGEEKLKMEREHREQLQRELSTMQARFNVRERDIDQALAESQRTINTQFKTQSTVKSIKRKVSKIIQQ